MLPNPLSTSINQTTHRPWPLPSGPWIMAQVWHDLLFAHWPISVEELRPLIPSSLEIDQYKGQAWIGIVPFWMSGVRARWLPAFPGLSTFPEINVRTYVRVGDKPGVYFFSLDATNPLAVAAARALFHLPYFNAQMSVHSSGDEIKYSTHRKFSSTEVQFVASYRPTGPVFNAEPGSLEQWLTERYCLYAVDKKRGVHICEIHHGPWPLQTASCEIKTNSMVAPLSLKLPTVEPLLHFSKRQDVIVWAPRPI